MRILITGASGFIGSHVAREWVLGGHEIHAIIEPRSDCERISDIRESMHLIEADLLSPTFVPPRTRFDLCVHLAWFVAPGAYLYAPGNQDWADASLRLMERLDCPRIVAAGSCFEYALTGEPLSESSRTEARTPYAQAKLNLFRSLESIDSSCAWVRFFYQYGPGEDSRRLVPVVIRSLLKGEEAKLVPGDRVRDYLYITDVARAVCAVAMSNLTGAVNIGSGQRTTVRDVASTIGELLGRADLLNFGAIPYRPDEPLDILADNSKLRTTGWNPQVSLPDGLRQTIKWWQAQMAS